MKKARTLTAALILGFLIGLTIKNVYNLTARQPCHWKYPPIILNCTGSEINKETIDRAVLFGQKMEKKYIFTNMTLQTISAKM